MRRYYLKIGAFTVPRVYQFEVSQFVRTQTKVTTLTGMLGIDQGTPKDKINAVCSLLSAAELESIKQLITNITQTIEYYDGNTLKSKQMYLHINDTPQPIYLYSDRTKGVYYSNYEIEAEEL